MSIRIKTWRTTVLSAKNALKTALGLGAILFVANSHLIVFNGYSTIVNNTQVVHCYESRHLSKFYYKIWHVVSSTVAAADI